MLKIDLHLHTKEDPFDGEFIKYSAKELISHAAKLNFDAIAITNHNKVTYSDELKECAEKKGILLIPGAEIKIKGKQVLVYNVTQRDIEKIKTFDDLRKIKNKDNMVIAPHPYFVYPQCLKKKLEEEIDVFDAIEYSHFYVNLINKNKKAVKMGKRYRKPLVGTSDAHFLHQMNNTYSLIDSKKDRLSIINAVKKNKVKIVTRPLLYNKFMMIAIFSLFSKFRKLYTKENIFNIF